MAKLESQYSAQVSAKLEELFAPAQVTGLAYTVSQGKVNLSWDAVTQNTEGDELQLPLKEYRVFRKKTAEESFMLLASVDPDQTSFEDTTAKDGATYFYAVAAVDTTEGGGVQGERSADLQVKTIPSIPEGLSAMATLNAIVLNWDSVQDETQPKLNENLAGYNVYRSEVDGSGYVKIGSTGPEETSFEDSTVVRGTTYYYVITAYDNSN